MAPRIEQRTRKSGSRTYLIGDREYPSVTTILSVIDKPALIAWAANEERTACLEAAANLYVDLHRTPLMDPLVYRATLEARLGQVKAHKRETAKAMDLGTQVHRAIEHQTRKTLGQRVGPEPALVDDALWAYMAWQDWAQTHAVRPVLIEQTVWSTAHGYAGTTDLVAWMDGRLTLCDYKTGKAVYPEARLQVAAYVRAINEMGHGPVTDAVVVRLPKVQTDPAFEVVTVTADELPELLAVFDHVHQLYLWSARENAKRLAAWQAARDTANTGAEVEG
jgi:hypothetical protein